MERLRMLEGRSMDGGRFEAQLGPLWPHQLPSWSFRSEPFNKNAYIFVFTISLTHVKPMSEHVQLFSLAQSTV